MPHGALASANLCVRAELAVPRRRWHCPRILRDARASLSSAWEKSKRVPAELLPHCAERCYVPSQSGLHARTAGRGGVRRMTARPANAHQARLLRLLRDGGPNSRAQLGDQVDLSRSKLAVEIDRLLETGLVVADGLAASRGGRRSHNVRLAPATPVPRRRHRRHLRRCGRHQPRVGDPGPPQPADGRARGPGRGLRPGAGDGRQAPGLRASPRGSTARGSACPGPVRFPEGVPVAPPIMPGWDGFPVREALSQELGCPVMVDNDVNLMAMGEQQAGVARSVRDFLCVKIGTGIGCGIVVGGEVYRGTTGSAGDIGHIQVEPDGRPCACGNRGCLEAYFGGAALARDAEAAARAGPVRRTRRPAGGRRARSPPRTSPPPPRRATPPRSTSSARAATASARSSPGSSASSTPDSW